jgi:hypothetical protein
VPVAFLDSPVLIRVNPRSIRGQEFDLAVEKLLSQFGTKADIVTSAILDDN